MSEKLVSLLEINKALKHLSHYSGYSEGRPPNAFQRIEVRLEILNNGYEGVQGGSNKFTDIYEIDGTHYLKVDVETDSYGECEKISNVSIAVGKPKEITVFEEIEEE